MTYITNVQISSCETNSKHKSKLETTATHIMCRPIYNMATDSNMHGRARNSRRKLAYERTNTARLQIDARATRAELFNAK